MTRYIWRRGRFVNKKTGAPMGLPDRVAAPRIASDLPAYKSPLGTGVIEGRAARREDLKRADCRELDPSEWKPLRPTKAELREG